MAQHPNQPTIYDAVLGGQTPIPASAAVLGGLSGVKRRLLSPVVGQRVAALKETLNYGEAGKDLLIWALKDGSWQVRQTAYLLLHEPNQSLKQERLTLKQALQDYNPYQLFQCLHKHPTPQSTAYAVLISPDGQLLISAGNDRNIKVRSLHTGKLLRTLSGHAGSISALAVSSEGLLASGSWDRTIKVWNLNTSNHANVPLPPRISPVSRNVGSGLLCTLAGHEAKVNSVAISPDGHTLASASEDCTIKLWNFQTGKLIHTLTGHTDAVKSVAISPDGKTLASGSADSDVKLWSLNTNKPQLAFTMTGHDSWVKATAISPNSQILASGSQDKTIKLWHLQTGELLSTLIGHWGEVNSVSISADGQTLISASWDETVRLWYLGTGTQIHSLEEHEGAVVAVAISPDGEKIVSSGQDQTIRVWGVK